MKKILLLTFAFTTQITISQVGIGNTSPTSTLDITAANATGTSSNVDGILIPRVDRERAQSMTSIPNGTMVFVNSIATGTASSTASNITSVGFYYFDTALTPAPGKWVKIESSGKNWSVDGNANTVAGTNFIGTTNAQDLRFKTGGTDRLNISNTNGQLQSYYAGAAGTPAYSWNSDADTGIFNSNADNLDFSSGGTARFRIPNANQVHALSLGTAALPFYSFSADTDTGMWSPAANNLAFSTAGTERARILSNGNTGIGSTAPTHRLTVKNDVDGEGVVAIDNAASGGFAGIYFHQGANVYRGHIGYVNTGGLSSFGGKGSFQIVSGDRPILFSTDNGSENFVERMIIARDGRVGIRTNPLNNIATIQPTSTLQVGGSIATGVTVITGNTTLTDSHCKIILNNGGSNITITLPEPSTCNGRLLSFSRAQGSTGTITLNPTGSINIQNLDGTISNTTTIAGHSVLGTGVNIQFWSDGSIWYR